MQEIFYLVGTIFAIVGLVLSVGFIVVIYLVYQKYRQLETTLSNKSKIAGKLFESVPAFISSRGFLALLPLIPTVVGVVMKFRKRKY